MSELKKYIVIGAAFLGALGVALAAIAAHLVPAPSLNSAVLIALTQAPAVLVMIAAGRVGLLATRGALIGPLILLVGAFLFVIDIVVRVLTGRPMVQWAAPFGGMMLILGWLIVAGSGFFATKSR